MAFAKPLSSGNPIGVGIRENIRGQGQQDPINRAVHHLKKQESERLVFYRAINCSWTRRTTFTHFREIGCRINTKRN